ncbi:hypothetical protein Tco_0054262 [Tanacetum coccineum]
MPPKRTSTSEAPAMTQAAIRKLVADSVTAALEAQATTMANTNNTNRNTEEREAHVLRKCSYKEFIAANLSISKVQKELLDLSAGLNELNQCFPVATVPKTARAPTDSVFDVEMEGFPRHCDTKEYHSECSGKYHNDIA